MDTETRRIVSVDGEGKTVDNRHAYTLLAAADDTGFRARIEHNGSKRAGSPGYESAPYGDSDTSPNYGLPTKDCLDFLLSIPQSRDDLIISFAFTYDATKVLQDLPFKNLLEFASLGMTVWDGYIIGGMPRKFFTVTRGERTCVVWDTFSYWQMAFAKALESSRELFSDYQLTVIDQIKLMKSKRPDESEWAAMSTDDVLDYCYSECEFLSIIYRDFLRHCDEMGLRPSRHSGPGSMADAFFQSDMCGLKQYMPEPNPYYLSGLPVDVAIHSYYGGRFETAILGPVGDVIEYDIQSAYPAIAVTLPCLRHGRFRRVKDYVPGKWGFYFVGSRTSGPWAPFPFRVSAETSDLFNGAHKGSIAYAHGGRRWVTSAEVQIAREHFGADAIPVFSGWVFDPGCNHKPFAHVRDLYLRRKVGNPDCRACNESPKRYCPEHPSPSEGLKKVIKLIINSVYGKLAQGIGWKYIESSQYGPDAPESYAAPQYQCYIWASWITGGTRAKVMDAALLGGENVVSVATDGILTTREIPELPVTDYELGTWEREYKPDCWLGMPGIYAFGRTPDDKKFKRRGLDSKYFPALHLREAFERGDWKVKPIGNPDECSECRTLRHACDKHPMRAFMPLKLAVTRTNALDVLGEWIPMQKSVKFLSVQHKRNLADEIDPFMPHDGSPIRLIPFTIPDDVMSQPYAPKQTWEDVRDGRIIETRGKTDDYDMPIWDDREDSPE